MYTIEIQLQDTGTHSEVCMDELYTVELFNRLYSIGVSRDSIIPVRSLKSPVSPATSAIEHRMREKMLAFLTSFPIRIGCLLEILLPPRRVVTIPQAIT